MMNNEASIELGPVQKTLLLPLWGRAQEMKKKKPRLIDPDSLDIINRITYDFEAITKKINMITQYSWVVRCLYIDDKIKKYIQKYPRALVVNIGCGLDTTFHRVDNGFISWLDIDLPDVIQFRQTYIHEKERHRYHAGSFLEKDWIETIQSVDHVFFFSAGVFYYFEENQMKDFFQRLSKFFPGSEIAFDLSSPMGVKIANKKVLKAGGFGEESYLKWGIDDPYKMESWDEKIKIIDASPMFRDMKKGIDWKLKAGTWFSDYFRIMSMVHISFCE